jgi:N utilization substance protein B
MTRRESRETAFALLFENTFTDEGMETVIDNAVEGETLSPDAFAVSLAVGAANAQEELDKRIEGASHKWSVSRISRVALSVMRLSLYEILYLEDIPTSVSINEAVELAKKYGGDEDAAFVNGVLGGIVKAC